MKKLMFFAVMLLTMGLSACSSDNETPEQPGLQTVKLAPARSSEVTFYSNGNKLDANGNIAEAAKSAKYAPFYITRAEGDELPDAVEVNFSINERQYDINDTKLSIHVRSTSDVTVFIPTGAEYYCPLDDMQIVQSHKEGVEVYSTEEHAEMEINGNKVELDITFAENGITVTTKGMNESVLSYLNETYGDGLTFEINNYYNTQMLGSDGNATTLTREGLKSVIDGTTTIAFANAPKSYSYAFGLLQGNGDKEFEIELEDGQKEIYHANPLDCVVVPANASLFSSTATEFVRGNSSVVYTYTRQ